MKIKSVNLETVCGITSKLPDNHLLEVAFAGRSNVGKSSLINALMNRKSYARTSERPGKTQTINYYNINDALYFVDLPGYGYAKVPQSVKRQWGKMINGYLEGSKVLRLVFLLVDIRHKPNDNDKQMPRGGLCEKKQENADRKEMVGGAVRGRRDDRRLGEREGLGGRQRYGGGTAGGDGKRGGGRPFGQRHDGGNDRKRTGPGRGDAG